ncbi:MAG TPA: hypothetical protein VGC45_13480 [Gryllotalpicola sp.]
MTTTPTLDPEFASAIRDELVAIGTKKSRLQRHQRRTRALGIGIAAVAVAAATTGAAVATNYGGLTTVTPAGTPVTVTHTGTATIGLGPAVTGANSVIVDLSCVSGTGKVSVPLTPGVMQNINTGKVIAPTGPETTEFNCGSLTRGVRVTDGYLAPGSTSITITVDPDTTWKATAQYGTATTSDWGINANGQTYGAVNKKNGMPDLEPVQATNGAVGYAFTKEMLPPHQDGDSVNVYESDGTTVIGQFVFGDN